MLIAPSICLCANTYGISGGNHDSSNPVISWDGSRIAFVSRAADLTTNVLGTGPLDHVPYLVVAHWPSMERVIVDSSEMGTTSRSGPTYKEVILSTQALTWLF